MRRGGGLLWGGERFGLAAIIGALLAAGACGDDYDGSDSFPATSCGGGGGGGATHMMMYSYENEVVADPELSMFRDDYASDDERCAAACRHVHSLASADPDDPFVDSCAAEAPAESDAGPWDPSQTMITITCAVTTYTYEGGCVGRRPHGHRELALASPSYTSWLRRQAHLERAAVAAFEELAAWLDRRGAPRELVVRCRRAAADEVRHADAFDALLRRRGIAPAVVEAAPVAPTLLEVALLNATEGCVSEAFGALLAGVQARRVVDPERRALFGMLAEDELRHGQLAWDLHSHLMGELGSEGRAAVLVALEGALGSLAVRAAEHAATVPLGLGWPRPREAASLAQGFVASVRAELRRLAA